MTSRSVPPVSARCTSVSGPLPGVVVCDASTSRLACLVFALVASRWGSGPGPNGFGPMAVVRGTAPDVVGGVLVPVLLAHASVPVAPFRLRPVGLRCTSAAARNCAKLFLKASPRARSALIMAVSMGSSAVSSSMAA